MKNKVSYAGGIGAMIFMLFVANGAALAVQDIEKSDKKQERQEIRQELKENIRERITTKTADVKKKGKILSAHLTQVKITAKSGNTLTVESAGKAVTVTFDDKTQMRRRFWGKSDISEMQIGDLVNIIGKWTDDAQTTVQAILIRDTFIQKRNGVFIGTVESAAGDSLVLKTANRGSLTVTLGTNTKITDRKERTITKAEIAPGHRLRVKGLWDSKANTVTEVSQAKDFSLPVIASPTPKAI